MVATEPRLRRLVRADRAAYRTLLENASAEDRYFRFFRPVREVGPAMVDAFVEPNRSAVALVAEDARDRMLAVAHAFIDDDGERAELAILVAHAAQRTGVGKRLVAALATELARRGCPLLVARSLEDNLSFSHLARALGMRLVAHDFGVLTWELPIDRMPARTARVA